MKYISIDNTQAQICRSWRSSRSKVNWSASTSKQRKSNHQASRCENDWWWWKYRQKWHAVCLFSWNQDAWHANGSWWKGGKNHRKIIADRGSGATNTIAPWLNTSSSRSSSMCSSCLLHHQVSLPASICLPFTPWQSQPRGAQAIGGIYLVWSVSQICLDTAELWHCLACDYGDDSDSMPASHSRTDAHCHDPHI